MTYNYQNGTWTTGSLARTTWIDASLYDVHATDFQSTNTPTFPTIQGVTNINGATLFYAHETGIDQVDSSEQTFYKFLYNLEILI